MLEKHGMQRYLINVLQGKSNSGVDDVYFFEDEETLREEYLKALQGVLIYTDVKEITKYSVEYLELKNENQEYKDNLNELWKELNNVKKRQNVWDNMK
jgi:predicted nuclease with TOPRIM domain